METSFKIVLDNRHPKKDSTLPLRLRVYQNRTYKEHTIGIYLLEDDWDDQRQEVLKSDPSHSIYNAKIAGLKSKARKTILLNEDVNQLSPAQLIMLIADISPKKPQIRPDILAYGQHHVTKLEAEGRIGNSIVYSCAINKLKKYANRDSLPFEEVNYSFIEGFNTALLAEGMKINGISNYLRTIRALFNKAIKEDIIPATCYPFTKFKIKNERTINRTLTIEEIRSIATYDLPVNSTMWHYRNLFMLSYCFIGINFADLLTLTQKNIVDGRIIFRRSKTHKVYSILIQPQAQKILKHYTGNNADNDKDFLLPFVINNITPLALKKGILQAIKNTNVYLGKLAKLCEIKKAVTTYYARYTWANISRSLGYSKDLIAEGLGHTYGNTVTGIYLDNYSNSVIDEMNEKVISHSFEIKGS